MSTPIRRWVEELSESERRAFIRLGEEKWNEVSPAARLAVVAMVEILAFEEAQRAALEQFEADHRAEVDRIAASLDWPEPPPPGGTLTVNEDGSTDVSP